MTEDEAGAAIVSSTAAQEGIAPSAADFSRLVRANPPPQVLQALLDGPLQGAVRAAAGYAEDATSEVTRHAYQRDWADFADWCRMNGTVSLDLPVNPVLVAAWLATLAGAVGLSALRRRIAAIAYHHRRRGHPFSSGHPAIRDTMAGIARRHRKPVRPAAALTSTEIRRLVETCLNDAAGTRDRALLLVDFAGALRRSELVAIDVDHLRFEASTLTIRVPRSKRDQEGKGADVTLPRMRGADGTPSDTCPVRALETWLAREKIRYGAVFRSLSEQGVLGDRLTGAGVRHILLRRREMAKLTVHPTERLSPHGLRAGFIAEAYLAGAPEEQVAQHSRHGDLSSMRGYRRRAKITADNPARLLDL